MITTPTGPIGSQVVARLLDREQPIRVIARDPSRLDPGVRDRVQVVQGSHDEPAVVDRDFRTWCGEVLRPALRGDTEPNNALEVTAG